MHNSKLIPNIYSKEKFVSIINQINESKKMDNDIDELFRKRGGSMQYPYKDIYLTLIDTLRIMFMDDNDVIGTFICEHTFNDNDDDNNDTETPQYESGQQIIPSPDLPSQLFQPSSSEDLYDYLVNKMIEKLNIYKNQNDNDFINVYKSIYKK